ncbi:MAG: hypothetical protein JST54_14790 [Deltaproteobacteria bacterium]|nr:hypothetical protein [Deltaproteobacteria bacterium]
MRGASPRRRSSTSRSRASSPTIPLCASGTRSAHAGPATRSRRSPATSVAAELLVQQGYEARARAALRLALELAPKHPQITRALEELEPKGESIESAVMELAESEPELEIEVSPDVVHEEPVLELPPPDAAPLSTARDVHVLGPNTVAVRKSSGDGWWVISSSAELQVTEVALEPSDEPVLEGVELEWVG